MKETKEQYNNLYKAKDFEAAGLTSRGASGAMRKLVAELQENPEVGLPLDGDIINAGGSITGGTNKSNNNLISQKFELENKIKLLNSKVNEIKLKEEEINNYDKDLTILEKKVFDANNELNGAREYIIRKNNV